MKAAEKKKKNFKKMRCVEQLKETLIPSSEK